MQPIADIDILHNPEEVDGSELDRPRQVAEETPGGAQCVPGDVRVPDERIGHGDRRLRTA